jgi:putative glycosyltransferase
LDLSIVTTLYGSAPFIREFCRRASGAAARLTTDYEIVLVNDGSPDESLQVAVALAGSDRHVRVIDLARNVGHHRAMMIGLRHATGRRVLLLDADLEEEPELLEPLWEEMNASGADVVYGVQATRKGELFERISGAIFWRLFNLLSDHKVPANMITLRLMTRRYVDALVAHEERELFLGGVWMIAGFEQRPFVVTKGKRPGTSYTLRRRIALMVQAVTSFSSKPLVLVFYLGLTISLVAGFAAAYLIVRKFLYGEYLMGWPSLIVSIWLLGGVTIFCTGIIGIYLSKIFTEVKRRPYETVRQMYGMTSQGGEKMPQAGEGLDVSVSRRS